MRCSRPLPGEVRKGKKAYQPQAHVEHTARYEGCDYVTTFLPVSPVVDRARGKPQPKLKA